MPVTDPARLLDAARSEAVRRGNDAVTPLHLAAVLLAEHGETTRRILGNDTSDGIAARLAALPRTFGDPKPDADVAAMLAAAPGAPVPDVWCERLRDWLSGNDVAQATTQAPGEEPAVPAFALSGPAAAVASVVTAPADLTPRPELADRLLALLAARHPGVPVVVGSEGSGRSTVAVCIAQRLQEVESPLSGLPVVLVDARAVIAGSRADAVRAVLAQCQRAAIVVLDDVEVLLALGSPGGADLRMASVIRGVVDDPQQRVVLVLAAPFVDRMQAADTELFEELDRVDLPAMPAEQVVAVVESAARSLATYHGVSFDDAAVRAAAAPPTPADTRAHPGLGVSRLDRAASAAALRPDRRVTEADVRGLSTSAAAVPARLDPDALRQALRASVVGQDDAVDRVVDRLAVTRAELDLRPERPDGVFLLAGPTGTGKTALALALARALYGRDDAVLRLDMSEYSEAHTVSKLVGSPPGYVGSDQPESWLTTRIRAAPETLLLLDEVEKAHPVVWNAFLQVFDAGRLTDTHGRTASFARATVVLTTNVGAEVFAGGGELGFTRSPASARADDAGVMRAVRTRMPPELVNRFDDVLVFRPLTDVAIHEIARRQVGDVLARAAARGWRVDVDDAVVGLLATEGYSREYGARPLQRVVERRFLQPLAAMPPGDYRATVADGRVQFDPLASSPGS